jgi:molybdate transport system regulatory protein
MERAMGRSRTRNAPPRRSLEEGSGPVVDDCRIRGRLWVEKGGETFLGGGRITLLERVREFGSITEAARSMKMGYRHAWSLIDRMNRLSPRPLIRTAAGGKGGGGTALTPEGEAVIEGFRNFVAEYDRWIAGWDPRFWKKGAVERKSRKR